MVRTTPSQALLPCPFCLQPAAQAINKNGNLYLSGCFNAACHVMPLAHSTCEAESCFKWNKREAEVRS